MAKYVGEFKAKSPNFIQISVLEHEEKLVSVPVFLTGVALTTGLSLMFPLLILITGPAALVLIALILSGDVSIVQPSSEEE